MYKQIIEKSVKSKNRNLPKEIIMRKITFLTIIDRLYSIRGLLKQKEIDIALHLLDSSIAFVIEEHEQIAI